MCSTGLPVCVFRGPMWNATLLSRSGMHCADSRGIMVYIEDVVGDHGNRHWGVEGMKRGNRRA